MTRVKVGERAPDFSAVTYDGVAVKLSDFLGQRALILFFYPQDGTSICTKEACSFRDSYEKFVEAGAQVIGISGDTDEAHRVFAQQHRLPFPLIADSDGSLRKLFGVPRTLGLFPGRVTYAIDKEGIVRLIYSAQLASDEHVRRALATVDSLS